MNINQFKQALRSYEAVEVQLTQREKLQVAQILLRTASRCIRSLNAELIETNAMTDRRKAKRRETELDPKPPTKPVRVAEPSKPKKPKYSGNHAPTSRR